MLQDTKGSRGAGANTPTGFYVSVIAVGCERGIKNRVLYEYDDLSSIGQEGEDSREDE